MNYVPVLAIALAATIAAKPQPSSDEIAIRNIIQEEITAWNSGDAAAYSRHFAADGTFTNIRGQFFTGGDAFIERHDFIFKGPFHGSTLKQDVVWIQKLSPGTNTDDKGRLRPRLSQVIVKDGGEWKIVVYHNTDVKSDVPAPDPQ